MPEAERVLRLVRVEHSYCKLAGADSTSEPSDLGDVEHGPDVVNAVVDVPDAALEVELGDVAQNSCVSEGSTVLAALIRRELDLGHSHHEHAFTNAQLGLLSNQSSRIKVAERLGQLENSSLFEDCRSAIGDARSSRTLDSLLTIPSGRLTKRSYNPVVTAFVDAITEVKDPATESAQCLRDLRRQSCIESLYSARHLKYVSEFFISAQAVAYAICGSKTVVKMMGHLGPGCSYHLLKDWMAEMASERIPIPAGFVSVGFDNEQRILKNWLARGSNRSSLEVLTNLVCAVHDEKSDVQLDGSLHPRSWRNPTAHDLLYVFASATDPLDSPLIRPLLFEYLQSGIDALVHAGVEDNVSKLVAGAV